MNPMWTLGACAGWALTTVAWRLDHRSVVRLCQDGVDQRSQLDCLADAKGALEHQVDGLNRELADALRDRDAAQVETNAKAAQLADVVAQARTIRDGAEVAVAQAARWKSERDALEAEVEAKHAELAQVEAEYAELQQARSSSHTDLMRAVGQREALQAEIQQMRDRANDMSRDLLASGTKRLAAERERDALQAKVDRMTSGLQHGRKPKVAAE